MQLGGPNLRDKSNLPPDLNEAEKVQGLDGLEMVQMSCGDHHAAAVDAHGDLYTWGGGKTNQFNKGQCGHGNTEFLERPKRVEGLSHKRVAKVSCGASHTLVLTEDQQLYTFGSGVYGECGHGDYGNVHTPKRIEIPKPKSKGRQPAGEPSNQAPEPAQIIDISAGGKHSMVLSGSGNLYTFGFGDQG